MIAQCEQCHFTFHHEYPYIVWREADRHGEQQPEHEIRCV